MVTAGRDVAQVPLRVNQGEDNEYRFRYTTGPKGAALPVDLSGWTARAQLRSTTGTLWATVDSGDEITLGSNGLIVITLPHATTETEAWDNRSSGAWDLELTSPAGKRIRLLQGTVTVSHDITRNG